MTDLFAKLTFLASIVIALGGLLFLSGATAGVGILAFAALLGIWSRIAQASVNHTKLEAKFDQVSKATYETALTNSPFAQPAASKAPKPAAPKPAAAEPYGIAAIQAAHFNDDTQAGPE